MNSKSLRVELSELSGIPEYKIEAMLSHLVKVIEAETGRGGTVDLQRLGTFKGHAVRAKTMKNLRDGDGVKTMNLPARKKLKFVPYESKKFI